MDDSLINPGLLSSSAHLENVAQLIKNIEKQTFIPNELPNLSSQHASKESLTKSLSTFSPSIAPLDDSFLARSILLLNENITNAEHRLSRRVSDTHDETKGAPLSSTNNDPAYAWDDQYDPRSNYCFTFGTDKPPPAVDAKPDKARRYKHRSLSQKVNPVCSDDEQSLNIANHMNDWSMRSSSNTLEQPQPTPPSSTQPQLTPANNSSGSSTTSSSTSWRQMKESQRTPTGADAKDARPPSPLCLYKIFQQKSTMAASSNAPSVSPFQRFRADLLLSNISNEPPVDKVKSRLSADQAVQTSMLLQPPSNARHRTTSGTAPKSDSFDRLASPPPTHIHKSLPDLSFISQYSKELPRSRATSPSTFSLNNPRGTPSPTFVQQPKPDADRPRTLKSIKRYKNSKHSTEPLNVFYSPQLRKAFAAVPMTIEPNVSQTPHLRSCLKPSSRASSCDIQSMMDEQKPPLSSPTTEKQSASSCVRRGSDADKLKHLSTLWSSKISNRLSAYALSDAPPPREHHSEHDLISIVADERAGKKSMSFSEDIGQQLLSPCNPSIAFPDHLPLTLYESNQRLTKRTTIRYRDTRRCQTDIIVVDPVLHLHSFTDSPPNEFCLHKDDDDQLMDKAHINIIPNVDEPVSIIDTVPPAPLESTTTALTEKDKQPSAAMSSSTLDNIVDTISGIVKRLLECKQTDKAFFLDNEQNTQLDTLLKTDFCQAIQTILEHGRKDLKKVNVWKIIEASIDKNPCPATNVPLVYHEAKLIAQNTSSYWLYKFHAFIFFLLNKNELVNWLYFFTRQKDVLQRYYQSPDALILVSIASTFNLFERIMTQLEKLTTLAFRLTYHTPDISAIADEQLNTSFISIHPMKTSARDWVMTLSRRAPKSFAQSTVQTHPNDTFRSTLSRRLTALFNKTNPPAPSSPAVTIRPPDSKRQSKSPGPVRRPRFSSVFSNTSVTAPTNASAPRVKYSLRESTPPSTRASSMIPSKIPRPSLNVDKAKSARYRSTAPSWN